MERADTDNELVTARRRGRSTGLATAGQLIDSGEHSITAVAGIVGVGRATLYCHLELTSNETVR